MWLKAMAKPVPWLLNIGMCLNKEKEREHTLSSNVSRSLTRQPRAIQNTN